MTTHTPDDHIWPTLTWLVILMALAAIMSLESGCVRSVTTCLSYDRALQRPDPNTLIQRDSAGASVCVESGPAQQ